MTKFVYKTEVVGGKKERKKSIPFFFVHDLL